MLKQRLITAAILIPLVVWALLALSTESLSYGLGLVALLAAWEWLQLMGFKQKYQLALVMVAMLLTGYLALFYLPIKVLLAVTLLIWFSASIIILLFAHKPLPENLLNLFKTPLFVVIIATVVLTGFVASARYLHSFPEQGPALLLFVLVSVWLADTGGYFAGKRFGKHKLAKEISPNKTWEGVAGALVLSGVFATGFYLLVLESSLSLISWLFLTALTVLISIVGDLFESVFKRCFNVKDSGQLLPGHGGILDRIDSLLAAVPVFTVAVLLMGAY
ncbi:phosphatidate cytidylyltransferase [Methylophaga thiooxydans]|uniref:Phosphatidate cytidylyltransferase n=1 Tax=Methylophaga thiooxydans DMS010 TaxID=637616 RepID=C0N9V8_9GAMM|nr:phosphatidate cytidylyltransferase [Methylophaga thiooxydans]EEF78483.1 phosphatidate cytidylyltransferase [Methylophaga thiooxydans DMS010]